ncbi:PMS1 protein homolog 1-like [Liolophura sinensis]|uniref:PMS1 protein homolog 1-like n=1 Tax=Liolophura sinensis TaxID=3198878 RepID=UPI003157F4ED
MSNFMSNGEKKTDCFGDHNTCEKGCLQALPTTTVRLLGSSQVITSVSSAVKELIENALDAGATSVEVKLEDYGLEKIEVRDNGCGIHQRNMKYVAKHYHTSKIHSFDDLELLSTYGFRGEALGSLCSVSNLTITSKTESEDVGTCITVNRQGEITSSKPSHFGRGTSVMAANLFKNLPVRKQFYSTVKKKKDELKRVEDLVMSYGVIRPDVRISLRHNKDLVWQKFAVMDHRTVLLNILGTATFSALENKTIKHDNPKMEMEAFIPKVKCKVALTSRATGDRHLTFVNKRPVVLKEVNKLVRQFYSSHHSGDATAGSRYPIYFLSVVLPSSELDVNVEPNKTRVMMENKDVLLQLLSEMLEAHYGPLSKTAVTANSNGGISNPQNSTTGKLAAQPGDDLSQTEYKTVQDDDGTSSKSSSVVERESRHGLSESVDARGLDASQEDSFGSFEIEIVTPEKTAEEEMDTTKNSASNDPEVVREENSAKGSNSYSVCDKDRKTSQKEEAFQELLIDLDEDDILCTFDGDSGKSSPGEFLNDQSLRNKSGDVISEEGQSSSVDSVNADRWSKGALMDSSGKPIQGPALLFPPSSRGVKTSTTTTAVNSNGKRPFSPSEDVTESPTAKKPSVIKPAQTTMFDLISSQPIKRPQTAFIHFSKEIRPTVVQENPGASFEDIARLIGQKWKNLTETDKQKYEEMTSKDVERYRQQMSASKEFLNNGKKKAEKPSKRASLSIKDCLMNMMSPKATKPGRRRTLTPRRSSVNSVTVPFKMADLEDSYSSGLRQSQNQTDPNFKLVGCLKSNGSWVCCHGNKIQTINTSRIEESVVYHRLMKSYVLRTEKLDTPTLLTKSAMNGNGCHDFYATLVAMAEECSNLIGGHHHIVDERLTCNGLDITWCKDSETSQMNFHLMGVTPNISYHGVKELREILEQITVTGAKDVASCRPLNVINYLKGEAVRITRSSPAKTQLADVEELLDQLANEVPSCCVTCLHDKPFYHELYDLSHVTFSQTQPSQIPPQT